MLTPDPIGIDELKSTLLARTDQADLQRLLGLTEGMISMEEGRLLYDLARAVQGAAVVEVGSYRGRSTVALARGSLDGHRVPVYAIDPHENFEGVLGGQFGHEDRGAFMSAMLATGSFEVVRLINLSSELVTPAWSEPIGLLWIDGDHRYEGVRRDFECWAPHLAEGAVVAFDDATDPELGPWKLLEELSAAGRLEASACTGKVRTFRWLG